VGDNKPPIAVAGPTRVSFYQPIVFY